MTTIRTKATEECLDEIRDKMCEALDNADCPPAVSTKLCIVLDEILSNVVHYAYGTAAQNEPGDLTVTVDATPTGVTLAFIDKGTPFDPLAHEDPSVTAPLGERPIGGLGIFLVKKLTDDVSYRYEDGQNILTVIKNY